MPLYEYACQTCEHTFEALVFGTEKVECPKCESHKLEKLLSMPGLVRVEDGGGASPCGDLSLPPCGAAGCRRTGR